MSSSALPDSLIAVARQWAETDPDQATQRELLDLLKQADDAGPAGEAARQDLADRFSGTLQFGTAGLRAPLGAGPMRMNRVVVRRTAAGVARFLNETLQDTAPRAVIGYDARYNSGVFARDTAAVFAAAGITTFLLPSALPTPVLAYAVRALDCDGGVMVTASHNPPKDNGYKVYLGGRAVEKSGRGSQIVSPYDVQIAAHIDNVKDSVIELAEDGWTVLPKAIATDYVAEVTALARPDRYPARDLKIVLTPLHGVGGATAVQVLESADFGDVELVVRQAEPDPDFPTVDFPNPEEPGALDLALKAAEDSGADLVLANDPDADRAAVAALDPATGSWRMLRGDEVGALLGAHMADRLRAEPDDGASPVFANSIVSSRLLASIARKAGYRHVETLTGFKWISRVPQLAYGYEEALGYCVAPDLVKDKDGISAALLIAELAAHTHAQGRTLFDLLDDLAAEHGVHLSDQLSVRVDDLDFLGTMMEGLRSQPPSSFAGSPVEQAVDLARGSEHLPPTDGLLYLTADQTRVIIRPSGTEPKLKCYLEVIEDTAEGGVDAAKARARRTMDAALADLEAILGLTGASK